MPGRCDALTARRVPCPTCAAPRFEYCVEPDGTLKARCHAVRASAARDAPDLTPGHLEMLRKLHGDPTRPIPPPMRRTLLRRGLIEPAQPTVATPGHRRGQAPKRHHPLTDAGRAVIGVVSLSGERGA
jgi:hypothetical protein